MRQSNAGDHPVTAGVGGRSMLQPVLLVGVGGSGGKTLRAMRQTLLRKIKQVGWTGDGLPEAWQMLWIDSISVQSADGFSAPLLDGEDYCGLVPPGRTYEELRDSLATSIQPSERMSATAGWVPESLAIATLFAHVSAPGSVFEILLDKFFDGEPDQATLQLIDAL
jgi:hypothetical protein